MITIFRIAMASAAIALSAFAAPANAVFQYAPLGEVATLQGAGEASSDPTIIEGVSMLTFSSMDTVSSRTFEFTATDPNVPTIPPDFLIAPGAANNGKSFEIGYTRTSGPGPVGQTGILTFTVVDTLAATVSDGLLQFLTMVLSVEVTDDSGTYVSPYVGTMFIAGSSSTSTEDISFNYVITLNGAASVAEPAVLGLLGSSVLLIGFARMRRR